MKYLSFVRNGRPGFGALVEDGIVDLTGRLGAGIVTLKQALRDGDPDRGRALAERGPDFSLSDVTLLPVIPDPDKILCIGLNYEAHRVETRRPESLHPTVFTRYPDSQIAHGQPILKPRATERLDYEGELAIVIGKGGRAISENKALDHVAGYACYNDVSARDWQRHTHQFTPGKNFPGTGAFGPALVGAEEIGDYRALSLKTLLNGEIVQEAGLDQMIFSIPEIIAYCSAFTPLSPGDVIVTGTPGGVGDRREPPLYMKAGDEVVVEIPGVGRLANPVVDEP